MSNSPARVIALVQPPTRERPDASWLLDMFLDWWLDTIAPDGLKPGSIDTYRSLSRAIWPDIKATPIGQLAPLDLQVMLSSQLASGRSRSTVSTTRACLSSALKSAAALGLIPVNPMQGVTTPTPSPAKRRVLSQGQAMQLLDYILALRYPAPAAVLIALMLLTGGRRNEIRAVRGDAIVLGGPTPRLAINCQAAYDRIGRVWYRTAPKSARGTRVVPLVPEAVEIVGRRLDRHPRLPIGDDWALGSTLAQPVAKWTIAKHLRELCQRAGVPEVTPHELRGTWATLAVESGMSIPRVARLLGDSEIIALRHYVKSDDSLDAAAVAAMYARPRAEAV